MGALAVFLTALSVLGLAQSVSFFVSTTGSDTTGDGSASNPFLSVARAQQAVRNVNPNMQEDITVVIREGLYFLPQPLVFSPVDSGTNGFTIHYKAAVGDNVIIHGGVQVKGWQPLAGTNSSVWFAALPDGVQDTRQVYINGDRMIPTNTNKGLPGKVVITSTGYTTTDPLPSFFAAQQNAADIEFLYTGDGSSWTECRVRVQSVSRTASGVSITMQEPGFSLARNKFYGQGVSTPVSVANIYSLLSSATPGQYYFNSRTRVIYYVPRPQDNMPQSTVIVPHLDTLVIAQGDTSKPAISAVRFLSFENLVFSYAGWLEPNNGLGYVDGQSGFRSLPNSTADDTTWVPVPGNLQFHTVENITIVNCTFTHLGAVALEIDNGSQNVKVVNNTFRDVSCGGVYVGQVNDVNVTDPTRENGHVLIHNNLFDGIPVEFRDCSAVLGGFMIDTNITHNTILNTPNTGISLGWGWSRDEAVNAGWNNIVGNFVFGSNWLLEDGGSIYVLGPQPASLMAENYVSNQKKLFGALYTD